MKTREILWLLNNKHEAEQTGIQGSELLKLVP